MLSLKSCQPDQQSNAMVATYDLVGDGGEVGVLCPVVLRMHPAGASASMTLNPVEADTEEAAFDRMADVLEFAAKALRARGEPKLGVPVY